MKKLLLSSLMLTLIFSACADQDEHVRGKSGIQHISDQQQFNNIIANNEYVVVDFFATWCGPCQKMLPIFSDLANDFGGQITFIKIDVQQSSIASSLSVRSIPTFLFYKNGKLQFRKTGAMSKDKLIGEIQKLVS
jgi:thioredoxin 1